MFIITKTSFWKHISELCIKAKLYKVWKDLGFTFNPIYLWRNFVTKKVWNWENFFLHPCCEKSHKFKRTKEMTGRVFLEVRWNSPNWEFSWGAYFILSFGGSGEFQFWRNQWELKCSTGILAFWLKCLWNCEVGVGEGRMMVSQRL